jgi:hypothetical protein
LPRNVCYLVQYQEGSANYSGGLEPIIEMRQTLAEEHERITSENEKDLDAYIAALLSTVLLTHTVYSSIAQTSV